MRPRLKAALAFAGVFALGVVTGASAMRVGHAHVVSSLFEGDPVEARHRAVLWALDHKLDLDAAQKDRIEAILAAHEPEFAAAQRAAEPQMDALFAKVEVEIKATLTPAQVPRFEELAKKFHARRRRAMGGPEPRAP